MSPLTLWGLGGLCLGGIIHIVAVLGMPFVTEKTPWNGIAGLGSTGAFHLVTRDDTPIGRLDPAMVHAACAFDLSGQSATMQLDLAATLWTVSVFDSLGRSVFALAGREPQFGLDLVTATAAEAGETAAPAPVVAAGDERQFAARVPGDKGFIVVRIYSPHGDERKRLVESLRAARCT